MLKTTVVLSILMAPLSSFAIGVGEITSFMESEQSILSKEITNTTNVARYIGLKVQRISSPMKGGEIIPMQSQSEILFTPASQILAGNAKEFFRIVYQGPKDNLERYYRLSWLDAPMSQFEKDPAAKSGMATTSAQIDTILVVAPRQENFKYNYNKGEIQNLGNASFRVVSVGACKNSIDDQTGKGCRERYFVMPGDSIRLKYTDVSQSKTHLGLWHKGQYIGLK